MPLELWLVRHAVATERDEFTGPDAERPLTGKGRRRFRTFCKHLADETALPGAVVTSPLLRAFETAAILARAAGLKRTDVLSTDLLAPGVDLVGLLKFVGDYGADRIALVGHEPDMSQCLSGLVGGGAFNFGKGFIAAVDFGASPSIGTGRLRWFAGPKLARGKRPPAPPAQ